MFFMGEQSMWRKVRHWTWDRGGSTMQHDPHALHLSSNSVFNTFFFVFELNYSKFYNKRCIPRTYWMRHIFLYCTFNLPWFPFHCHRSKHKLWFLIPHNKVQKYRTTIVQDSRTPTPCLILVGHLFGSPIYHPPMQWVESPPPAWESEFPPTINFNHLLTLLPGCFLLMWDYERGSENSWKRRNSKGYWWDSRPVDTWSLAFGF